MFIRLMERGRGASSLRRGWDWGKSDVSEFTIALVFFDTARVSSSGYETIIRSFAVPS